MLSLYVGPMFAGKSTELIREAGRYQAIGESVLKINHILDTRYGTEVIHSHSGNSMKCTSISSLSLLNPAEITESVVVIDEGHFFPGLLKFCLELVEDYGKIVIVGALDSDSNREKFGEIQDLSRYCDTVIKLKAFCRVCKDHTLGIFTHRKSSETSQILVGIDEFIPVCRRHWIELNKSPSC